ncbi:MAG: 50S ribosomal protein L15 [Candidatus Bathyarchaeota archaeon]|nr:50S ribosomal protein L15 [Candidatus Bathyarchaeota archaeon]
MPHKLRKHRKLRGSRTQGYGRIGQHRDAGSKGHRKVGMHKHLWSIVANMDENYFGKNGFTSRQSLHRKVNVINLNKLDDITLGKESIDLTSMGFTKLLGTGKITKALTVTVPACSTSAAAKIEAAGGKVLTEEEIAEAE